MRLGGFLPHPHPNLGSVGHDHCQHQELSSGLVFDLRLLSSYLL